MGRCSSRAYLRYARYVDLDVQVRFISLVVALNSALACGGVSGWRGDGIVAG